MKRITWATAVSIGVHAALMTAVAYAPSGWFEDGTSIDPITFEIIRPEQEATLETRAVADDEALEPEPLERQPEEPQRVAASSVIRPSMGPVEPVLLDPPLEADVAASTTELRSRTPDGTPTELTPEQFRRLINPGNVARENYIITGPGPTKIGPPAGRQSIWPRPMTEDEIEQRHYTYLRGVATARPWLTPTEPELQRQSDGSQRYEGTGIVATIHPDGTFDIDRRGNVQGDGINLGGSFDITEAIMGSAGQDTTAAEQEWFTRHTQELRDRLVAAHLRATMESAIGRLRGRLWRASRGSGRSRRRALFSIWDESADDESGAEARRIVITFIRDELPAGSDDAFTESEIEHFNASRESTERFAPY